jgi:hypothetical protein
MLMEGSEEEARGRKHCLVPSRADSEGRAARASALLRRFACVAVSGGGWSRQAQAWPAREGVCGVHQLPV